ncbi:unnamed protein product [Bathycoccus prasinos]
MFAAASFVSSSSFASSSSSSLRTRTSNNNNNNNNNSGRRGELHVLCAASKSRAKKRAAKLSGDDGDENAAQLGKKETSMSKQQKDKLRKQRSEKLRAIVSSEGRRYEKIQKDFSLTRDTAREYVLSVRQKGGGGGEGVEGESVLLPLLTDWLPVAEILVADRVSLEATMAFKKLGMDMPETDDNPNEPKKIDGVPAVTAMLPGRKTEICAMAFNIAGAPLRDIEHVELEYGIEDWGSFENCVDGLAARSGDDGALDRAYAKIGATANEEPREIKAKYRKLIATAHPDRNPDADVAEFNAIKDAYELIVGKDCGGASFEGLGTNRDFIVLDGTPAHFGEANNKNKMEFNEKTILFAMRSLVGYDRVGQHFNARNLRLAKAKGM